MLNRRKTYEHKTQISVVHCYLCSFNLREKFKIKKFSRLYYATLAFSEWLYRHANFFAEFFIKLTEICACYS